MEHKVLILMGSDSDYDTMSAAATVLESLDIACETHIASAHRTPHKAAELTANARDRGFGVIIAGAGLAAHLPGVVASHTTLPVIGVPLAGGPLNGVDALYAVVQMPKGVPVATVGVGNAHNAGLLAAQILSTADDELAARFAALREQMAEEVERKDSALQHQLQQHTSPHTSSNQLTPTHA